MKLTRWQRLRTRAFLFSVGVKRRMTLGTRGILLDDDRVFLIRHTYMPGWQFPGGGVEPGETAEESVAREILEETGHEVTGPVELLGFYHNTVLSDRDHVAVYVCRHFRQLKPFAPNYEIAEAGWFSRTALPNDLSPGTARRLDEIFAGAPRRPTW